MVSLQAGKAAGREDGGRPLAALLLGVLAISTGAILVRMAEAPAAAVAFWRCALASLLIAPFAARPLYLSLRACTGRERRMLLAAGFFLALHFASWIRSLDLTTVAASVVLVNTTPLWVALLAPHLSSDRVTPGTWAGALLAFAGAAIIGLGDLIFSPQALLGDALALFGGLCGALYVLAGRRLRRGLDLWPYALACYGSASLFLFVFALLGGTPLLDLPPATWGWLAALAIGPQLLGHSAYNYALRWTSASLVAVAMLGEPILASALAWGLLGERAGASTWVGAVCVLAGVAWTLRAERAAARISAS